MSKIKISGNASGTGVVTLTAPNTNTDRTITLPDDTQTLIGTNASGNVGIGTAAPTRRLTVQGSSGDNVPIRVVGGAGTIDTFIDLKASNTTADYKVRVGAAADDLSLYAGGTEKLRIQSGGGISFNGDTAAANALDDYEEGTFTLDNVTSGTVLASYVKIGKMVHCNLDFSSVTLSDATSGGLPFAIASGFGGTAFSVYTAGFGAPGTGNVLAPVFTGTAIYWRYYVQSTGSFGTVTDLTGDARFTFSYQTDS